MDTFINNVNTFMNNMNTCSNETVAHFMHYIQIGFCLFSAFILIIINNHIKNTKTDNRKDHGLDFIAGVFIVWAVQSLIPEMTENNSVSEMTGNNANAASGPHRDVLSTILSTFNNGLLLASLTFFIYGFDKIRRKFETFNNPDKWIRFVLLWSIILSTFLIGVPHKLATYFDLVYSSIVLGAIGYAITVSFQKRGYGLAFLLLGIFFTLLNLISQILPYLNPPDGELTRSASQRLQWENALIVCSQVFFIILLLILAQTWAVEVEQKKVSKTDQNVLQKNLEVGIPNLNKPLTAALNSKSTLKIGINYSGNTKYFFEFYHPNFERPYITRMPRPTNVFKFLLSLANAKKERVPHTIKIKAAGTTTYSSADFNNILIRDLNDKLTREQYRRIKKEELLSEVEGNWEISLPYENIELIELEEMKIDEQLSEIFQI